MNIHNTVKYGLITIILVCGSKLLAGDTDQPIRYNHKIHIEDVGLTCADCHIHTRDQARASIPNIEICVDCHDEAGGDNIEAGKVGEYVEQQKKIPWVQIHKIMDYAYFSHRRHVVLGQLECAQCHGDVGAREKPFSKPFVEIKMAWCLDCHEQRAVTTDCYACHR